MASCPFVSRLQPSSFGESGTSGLQRMCLLLHLLPNRAMRQVRERRVPNDCGTWTTSMHINVGLDAGVGKWRCAQSPAATHLTRAGGGTMEKITNCTGSQN
eukprot:2269608-Prymnesium_polylepis.1